MLWFACRLPCPRSAAVASLASVVPLTASFAAGLPLLLSAPRLCQKLEEEVVGQSAVLAFMNAFKDKEAVLREVHAPARVLGV